MIPDFARRKKIPGLPGVELLTARYANQRFARHFHDCYAVGVIEDGALGFDYLGGRLTAKAGDINLAVPGEPHTGYPAGESGWAYRMFYLSPEFAGRAAGSVQGARPPFFREGVLGDERLAAELLRLHRAIEEGSADVLAAESELVLLLRRLFARIGVVPGEDLRPRPGAGKPRDVVRRAAEYLRENASETVTLKDLSSEVSLSPYHLLRLFEEDLGLPPHAYLAQLRVGKAGELIARGRSLAEAAQDAGFADQSHMNRLFRRILGLTPGAYRNSVQDA